MLSLAASALALAATIHNAAALPLTSLAPRAAVDRSAFGLESTHLSKNNVYLGIYPNGDEAGIKSLNAAAQTQFQIWGTTLQVQPGQPINIDAIVQNWPAMKDANTVPLLDVMPVGGWKGFTDEDDSQARLIAQHCKNIQSQGSGKAVWLRFGVDMNYWQSDDGGHKYSGNADDFKKAWKVLAKALKETSPDTKLLWTPAASKKPEDAAAWYPKGQKVDAIGFSYHSTDAADTSYKQRVQDFYAYFGSGMNNPDVPIIMGPVSFNPKDGTSAEGAAKQKSTFLNQVTSADIGLPNYIAAVYNNEKTKKGDARIVYTDPEAQGDNAEWPPR